METGLIAIPEPIQKYVSVTVNKETGKRQVARVSCAAYGRLTGLKGKELNRQYDAFKDQFNGAFRSAAHRLVDTRHGAKITETATGVMTISLERPKITKDSIQAKIEALQAQMKALEDGEPAEAEVVEA